MRENFELNNRIGPMENDDGVAAEPPQFEVQANIESKENENAETRELINTGVVSLIKKIEEGGKIPDLLQGQIQKWCRHIDLIDKDIRADFLFTLLDNPSIISDEIASEAIMNLASNGPELVLEMKEMISGNKDIGKAIKNIRVLQYLAYQNDYEAEGTTAEDIMNEMKEAWDNYQTAKRNNLHGMREERDNYAVAAMAARHILAGIRENSDNFFIRSEIDQELENLTALQENDQRLMNKYDEQELRENYNIRPVSAEGAHLEYEEEITRASIYSRLNHEYAVIYTPDHLVDSFFELSNENSAGVDQKVPKRLAASESNKKTF
jgi:hypothetical protein